jgi:hypothetical protein
MDNYITNPLTGRNIQVGGVTHKNLLELYHPDDIQSYQYLANTPSKQQKYESLVSHNTGKRKPTGGWSLRAPQKGTQRHELYAKCGDDCFLHENEGFPICPRCDLYAGECECKIDCTGVQAAYNRARQWGYDDVAAKATNILNTRCSKKQSGGSRW